MAMTVPRQTGSRRKLQRCRTWGSATVELALVAPTLGPSGYPGDFSYLKLHKTRLLQNSWEGHSCPDKCLALPRQTHTIHVRRRPPIGLRNSLMKHIPGDLRYWGITDDADDLGTKQSCHPDWADAQVREHAGNLLWTVKEALGTQPRAEGRLPVLCAPFDAELFGHWWFEGPQLLIAAWSARDYVEARVQSHHTDLKRVVALAPKHARGERIPDEEWAYFGELCQRDHLFADIQPEWYTG